MTKIKSLHPDAHFFVPLGNKQWCLDSGIKNATELDWWEERDLILSAGSSALRSASTTLSDIKAKISCLPCQHTSGRGPFDKAATLWASWAVESGGKKVWFGGYATIP
jgi:N-acyl-phosphatidylethanolamine-hydrolysing phospholipase D